MVSMTSLPTLNAHGWVVNLLQPSGTIILKGGTARSKNCWYKNDLNIFEILELFKKEQVSTEVEIRQLMAEGDRHHVKEKVSQRYL